MNLLGNDKTSSHNSVINMNIVTISVLRRRAAEPVERVRRACYSDLTDYSYFQFHYKT